MGEWWTASIKLPEPPVPTSGVGDDPEDGAKDRASAGSSSLLHDRRGRRGLRREPNTVRRWIEHGEIKATKFHSQWRVPVRAWQLDHKLPFLKIGGTVRFVPSEIRVWASYHEVRPRYEAWTPGYRSERSDLRAEGSSPASGLDAAVGDRCRHCAGGDSVALRLLPRWALGPSASASSSPFFGSGR